MSFSFDMMPAVSKTKKIPIKGLKQLSVVPEKGTGYIDASPKKTE